MNNIAIILHRIQSVISHVANSSIVKGALYNYFYWSIKFLWFITNTTVGYTFYIFTVSAFFSHEMDLWSACSFFFVLFTLGLAMETFVLVKIPLTRRFLDQLLGKEFIIDHLGKHTATTTLFKALGPIILFGAANEMAKEMEFKRNWDAAENYERGVDKVNEKHGYQPSREEDLELQKQLNDVRGRPVHGMGDVLRHAVRIVAEAVTPTGGDD